MSRKCKRNDAKSPTYSYKEAFFPSPYPPKPMCPLSKPRLFVWIISNNGNRQTFPVNNYNMPMRLFDGSTTSWAGYNFLFRPSMHKSSTQSCNSNVYQIIAWNLCIILNSMCRQHFTVLRIRVHFNYKDCDICVEGDNHYTTSVWMNQKCFSQINI